jgi:Raf kinase inhibitor-like YbhB/YbcL family protein
MSQLITRYLVIASLICAICGCRPGAPPVAAPSPAAAQPASFQLTSRAFSNGESIPPAYTCDGEDISPPLQWGDPPQGAQSLALILDDPDAPAGIWVHWVLYNLPADARALPEGISPQAELPDGGQHGQSSWQRLGYGGPCPPSGTHRYIFKLYALDTRLDVPTGASKSQVLRAMEGHILAQAELTGLYTKR